MRSAYRARRTRPDLDGVTAFRTRELRPGWVPSLPRGRRCSSRTEPRAQPAPAASQRPVPLTPLQHPILRGCASRGINEGSSNSPVRPFPSPATAQDGTGRRLGFPPSFAPRRPGADDARRGGDRPPSTDLELLVQHHIGLILQSCSSLTACDLASQRGKRARRPRASTPGLDAPGASQTTESSKQQSSSGAPDALAARIGHEQPRWRRPARYPANPRAGLDPAGCVRPATRQTRASRCRRAAGSAKGSAGAPAFSREQGGVDVRSASLRAPLRRRSREQSHAPCLARNSGSVAASTTRKAPARRQRRPSRALRVPGRRRRDARRGGKGGVRRFGARAAGAHQGGAWCTLPFRSERRPRGRAVRRASRAGPGRTRGRGWGVAVALVTAAEGWKRAVVPWRRGSASTRGSPESRALAKPWGEASRRRLRQPGRRCRRPSGARACLARRSARWPGSHGRR